MQAAKTFDRNGIRYRPGDALPPDLDAPTLAHYRRHGMVREARTPAPAVKKPAARKPQATAKPQEDKTATADSAAPGTPGTLADGPVFDTTAQADQEQSQDIGMHLVGDDGPDLAGLPSAQEGAPHA